MTNEQKAQDITKCLWFPQNCTEDDIQNMLMQMAQWKDEQHAEEKQQLIDKASAWLQMTMDFFNNGEFNTDKFVNDFKQAMKGE